MRRFIFLFLCTVAKVEYLQDDFGGSDLRFNETCNAVNNAETCERSCENDLMDCAYACQTEGKSLYHLTEVTRGAIRVCG